MIRVRYQKVGALLRTRKIHVPGGSVEALIDPNNLTGTVMHNGEVILIKNFSANSLPNLKKEAKYHLETCGVNFQNEVRIKLK